MLQDQKLINLPFRCFSRSALFRVQSVFPTPCIILSRKKKLLPIRDMLFEMARLLAAVALGMDVRKVAHMQPHRLLALGKFNYKLPALILS